MKSNTPRFSTFPCSRNPALSPTPGPWLGENMQAGVEGTFRAPLPTSRLLLAKQTWWQDPDQQAKGSQRQPQTKRQIGQLSEPLGLPVAQAIPQRKRLYRHLHGTHNTRRTVLSTLLVYEFPLSAITNGHHLFKHLFYYVHGRFVRMCICAQHTQA